MSRWFKGDTHLHTVNSDGLLHQYELIEKCKKAGLDWIIITDHNFNTVEKTYSSDGLLVIQGQELTDDNGHVNVWGEKVPEEPPYDLKDKEAYIKLINKCKKSGATVCANHPFCSNCGFTFDIDNLPVDCVEVWNTIQHSDNVTNLKWWEKKLLSGERLAAVGGSDFHRDYGILDMMAMPTTITYAKSNTKDDILAALREGRSVITIKPDSSMIYLSVEDAMLGDSIELKDGLTGSCTVTKLLPRFTLRIFNNEKIIYEHKATVFEKEHNAVFGIKEKGFVRAEIDYKLTPTMKKLVGFAENKFMSSRNKEASPTADELFWAFTNPIWIE